MAMHRERLDLKYTARMWLCKAVDRQRAVSKLILLTFMFDFLGLWLLT
jgi:hypothetical protein